MKRAIYLLLGLSVITALILVLPQGPDAPDKVSIEKKLPTNPGWWEQWLEMKAGPDGQLPMDLIREIRREQRRTVARRGAGNLQEIKELGPYNVGGRTRALVIDNADPNRLLAGGISGGLWESLDRGQSWKPVDDFSSNLSITYLDQNPFDPNILYYSTGEPAGNSAGIPGDGVYKSTDGGKSFFKLPGTDTSLFDYAWRVKCSPIDTNTVYVATRNNGLFRSVDGGDTFRHIFSFGNKAISDIELMADSGIWVGVNGSGVFYSPSGDSGTFNRQFNGLPLNQFSRIELAFCRDFPGHIYAAFEHNNGDELLGVYKTTDGGDNWIETTNPDDEGIRFNFPWYCLALEVHPTDTNYVMIGSVTIGRTKNGGNSWDVLTNTHSDYHIFRFDPLDYDKIFVGNDGGLYLYDRTTNTEQDLNNGYNVTQFYTGAFFPTGLDVYGGTQDNGTQSTKSAAKNFEHIFGGDGAFTQIDQTFPTTGYVSYQNGRIHRTDDATGTKPHFYKIMNELDADDDNSIDDGAWFINPFEINPTDGEQIYFPTRTRVWRTVYGGIAWEPMTNSMVVNNRRPYSIGISNEERPTIYIGGAEGLFYRVDDAYDAEPGDEVILRGSLPDSVLNDFIVNITVHHHFDSVIYVAFSNFSTNPRLYKVVDAKSSPVWENISEGLPRGVPVNWVQVSPLNDSIIFAATDYGLYSTVDAGATWQLEEDIPKVSIHMIRLRPTDGKLFIFTHGRGIWLGQVPGDFPTGTGPDNEPITLRAYPNPVGDVLNIHLPGELENAPAAIYSLQGQRMWAGRIKGQLRVAEFSKGMYVLVVEREGGKPAVLRFIKG